MLAADVEIMHQPAVLDVETVAGRGVAMGDQHALAAGGLDLHMGLDGVAAAAHIRRDVGRHMAHSGVKHEVAPRAVEARRVFGETRSEAVVERQHVVGLRLAPPGLDHGREPVGFGLGQIVDFGEITIQVKQLPFIRIERRARRVIGDCLPARVPEAAVAEHFEILRLGARWRVGLGEAAGKAFALDRHLRTAGDLGGRADADHLEQGGDEIDGVNELMAQLATGRNLFRPGDHQRVADAAAMGVLLVAAQRRVGGHRPAMREVRVRIRTADAVDARELFRHRFRAEVVGAHRIDHAERAAFLAGAIVREHDDQGVVADAGGVEERDQARQMLVGMVEHAGISRLQPGEDLSLLRAVGVPRLHTVIARRHLCLRGNEAHGLLARHPLFAFHVPAVGEQRIVALDQVGRCLMRRMASAESEPCQPRQVRPVGDVIGDEADRLVDQVGGEVIAAGEAAGRRDL